MSNSEEARLLPLLPLRDIVVFPHMMVPLYVGRAPSIKAVEEAMRGNRELLLAAQKKAKTNDPVPDDIYAIGTVGQLMQHIKRPDGTVKVLVEGKRRARIRRFLPNDSFFLVEVEEMQELEQQTPELEALLRTVHEVFENYARLSRRLQPDVLMNIKAIDDAPRLADTIVAHLPIKHPDKQAMLEMQTPKERLEKLYELMQGEIEILQVERKIRSRVKKQMERTEKEYYLNEQMRAIQKELGERDEFKNEINELEEKLKAKKMPEEARDKVEKEVKKLKMMSPMSAEATVVRNYIDWCLSLPWFEESEDQLDMVEAEQILEEDHYGLKKPKERILEYLAVQKLVDKMKGPILCLVGPPGVGKTSLGRSIARATGRQFVRQSLGGVRDEAEIRGHRRTYIGALPGKIIQSLKRAGTSNPVFLLDEIDKMSMDFRGDPSAALLEVLDPEQNNSFNDHYLDMDYDLSSIMFVCTANTLQGIPAALEDRLEIIRIAGYTELEKMSIADRYLVPKQRRENGLADVNIAFGDQSMRTIIQLYTREAGVRQLEREIASICRKLAKEVVQKGKDQQFRITPNRIKKLLGVPKFRAKSREENDEIGMATGLAWTQMGGEILNIEVTTMPGKGKLTITGKLGDVMQESAQAAMSYVRSRAESWGLAADFYSSIDIHIHVPEGATPKDGPSAGITMATALVSALTRIPVRHDLAMTGEITLRGRVLPIGGLKEKILAAHRAEIREVIIPKDNEKDLEEVPKIVAKNLKFHTVEHLDEVLRHALVLDSPDEFFGAHKTIAGESKVDVPVAEGKDPNPAVQ
ncbi:MAG: endopeptidase La [Deltaproteobacteria bacterium RIFOXYA12_FULL_58_15]|nr:MAG: endopeptidase La [Deltaproteobacteria bacterium RIFOXYA12_FULL_58_15]